MHPQGLLGRHKDKPFTPLHSSPYEQKVREGGRGGQGGSLVRVGFTVRRHPFHGRGGALTFSPKPRGESANKMIEKD